MAFVDIGIISLPVADSAAAKAFYTDILGFKLVRDNPMGPGMQWVELSPAGQGPNITLVTWFDRMKPGDLQGLVLNTDDIDADRDLLLSKGVSVGEIDEAPYGRFASFKDLDGNGWILQGAPKD